MPPRQKAQPETPARLAVIDHDGTKVVVYQPDVATVWAELAKPFPEDWVEKLPKPVKRGDDNRGRCDDQSPYYSADGHFCGGLHSRSVHLDYVGHAGITMRLNDVLGPDGWEFRPLATDPQTGQPILSRDMFWGSLTILGHTHVDVAANFSSPQEAYGDALRRCAMRFGMGTYLWSKSDAALEKARTAEPPPAPPIPTGAPNAQSDPDVYAPNGQPWRNADGSANRAALEPHQQAVFDAIATLVPPEPSELTAWWTGAASLPHTRELSEAQAEAVLEHIKGMVASRPAA